MRALFLIDGEHYPPVVIQAIKSVEERFGAEGVAAALLGGTEKIQEEVDYGLPLVTGASPVEAVIRALERHPVDLVVDLSDEPVVGYRERMAIASRALAAGARYIGSDFEIRPPEYHKISTKPAIAVIGTGKRVGKTAISGYIARLLSREGFNPGVVSMGRGGPERPEVVDGGRMEVGSEYLLQALAKGIHAASDYYETAALSRVVTVGCRRCGGGLAGEPFVSNVLEGAKLANALDTGITIFDGSGAAIPPVEVGRRVLVVGANQDPEYITGYLGAYRLLISDLLLLTMVEEPLADGRRVEQVMDGVEKVNPGMRIIPIIFRPRPIGDIKGLKIAYVSTAPPSILPKLKLHLERQYGCQVAGVSGNLSDRKRLAEDLNGFEKVDAYLTEIKAAAVDMVTLRGADEGVPVLYCDNEPVGEGLDGALTDLIRYAAG